MLILESIAEARAHGLTDRRQHPGSTFCNTSLGPLNLETRTLKDLNEILALGKRAEAKPPLKTLVLDSLASTLSGLIHVLDLETSKEFKSESAKPKDLVLVWLCLQFFQTYYLKYRS